MLRQTLIAAALFGAAPALASGPSATAAGETRVPRMAHYLDWRPDGTRGLYIRADTGRWYYARLDSDCPRMALRSNVTFEAAPNGDFDRYGAVVAQGWRCRVASVTHSDAPPGYRP